MRFRLNHVAFSLLCVFAPAAYAEDDMLMLRLAMAKHKTGDEAKLRQQVTRTMEATAALRNVALRVWETYCRARQITP